MLASRRCGFRIPPPILYSRANFKGLWLRFNLLVTTRRA